MSLEEISGIAYQAQDVVHRCVGVRFGDSGIRIRAARDSMTPTPETSTRSGKSTARRPTLLVLRSARVTLLKR